MARVHALAHPANRASETAQKKAASYCRTQRQRQPASRCFPSISLNARAHRADPFPSPFAPTSSPRPRARRRLRVVVPCRAPSRTRASERARTGWEGKRVSAFDRTRRRHITSYLRRAHRGATSQRVVSAELPIDCAWAPHRAASRAITARQRVPSKPARFRQTALAPL